MPSSYALTLRDVINGALRLCNDFTEDGNDGRMFTWDEARRKLWESLIQLAVETGILKDVQLIPLTVNSQIYDLPPNCVRLLRVQMNGPVGKIVLPKSVLEYDMAGQGISSLGDPENFFRDKYLPPNQIGFVPIPRTSGSTFTRDSDYGLLREIVDGDGNRLPFDDNLALRRITGVPFIRSGDGNIIRGIVSPYGNIQVTYVRVPDKWIEPGNYPDSDIPEYVHKDFKYGIAEKLLFGARKKLFQVKQKRFAWKWQNTLDDLKRYSQHMGNMANMEAL